MKITYAHTAINCENMDRIIEFYTTTLGFQVDRIFDVGGGKRVAFIRNGSAYLELFDAEGERPVPKELRDGPAYSGLRHIAFTVDDVDAMIAQATAAGAKVNLGPARFDDFIPGWKSAWLADPEGNVFEVSQGYAPAE
jgi:glyoxylase I family protein